MEKILICDDSKNVRTILSRWLKEIAEVVQAEHGKLGLREYHKAIKSGEPMTLAVIDLSMPEMGGEDVIRHIRQYEEACDIFEYLKIIVLTGDEDKETIRRVFNINVDHFVNKPLDIESFKRTLKKLNIQLP